MLGGYIKMYGRETKIYQLRRRVFLSAYIAMALLTFLLSYFTNPYGYAYITNVLGATACFILFAKWNMGQNRLINWISGSAFDVYFVHSDKNTSLLLIYELLGAKYIVDTPWIAAHAVPVVAIVWILGICTYKIRKALFSISIDKLLDGIGIINRKIEI